MTVSLSDRYTKRSGTILISGVQALVRLMILQWEKDQSSGLNTGGFVSGYRGSPLGVLDSAFASASDHFQDLNIKVMPAVNEEMAATAIAGTQQIDQTPSPNVQGVFSLWYGKGPGFDRASDAIRHGNYQGSSPQGGVVVAVGDDHLAKSSSIVCYSDETIASVQLPLFSPADAHEVVLYGLHGFAASRHTGSWVGLKIFTEVADSTRVVPADESAESIILPEVESPPGGLYNRWPIMPLEQEAIQQNFRLPAIQEYVRANNLDKKFFKTGDSRMGIVAAGKTWLDVQEAMRLLGLSNHQLSELGLALYKPAMTWPLEPSGIRAFSLGLESLIVVEEKGAFIESQAKNILYGVTGAPTIEGKKDLEGRTLFPPTSVLTAEQIALNLGRKMLAMGAGNLEGRLGELQKMIDARTQYVIPPVVRKPFFCSGCPHNRSTAVPEGSRALAGIGCHGLAAYHRPRTSSFAQMGGEGAHWVGLESFTDEKHVLANMGDGTYFHSGLLAIRQSVAANANITYKLLYNAAVAMTGGQAVDGELSVEQMAQQLKAEGIRTIILSTEDPSRYGATHSIRRFVERVEHRDDLEALQNELSTHSGVSVIIYEQMCATEKRRMRKRGRIAQPARRVFINELVCEGCGDCSLKSNCLSVEPINTEFGVKRRINQSSCNVDESCLNGFCPSFVSVEGKLRKPTQSTAELDRVLADPVCNESAHQRMVVAGVGGTGVVTIGALLSMSGHIGERKVAVLDQVGMAQKGGAVTSHIHIGNEDISTLRVSSGEADLVIVADPVVGNMGEVISSVSYEKTFVLVNSDTPITGDFTQNRDAIPDSTLLSRRLANACGSAHFFEYPFTALATALLGNAIGSNLIMVGFAYQKGWLQLTREYFEEAINLNGVAISSNLLAFEWGRKLAVDEAAVMNAANMGPPKPESIDDTIQQRADFLTDYQDCAYAEIYKARLEKIRQAEARVSPQTHLTETVAKSLFKLMAYKDEYEVARLYRSAEFKQALAEQFEDASKMHFYMAPPLIARRDKTTGQLRKMRFGRWMMSLFGLLAHGKRLRGTVFDPLGFSAERKVERALIKEFNDVLDMCVSKLEKESLSLIIEITELPMEIKGYGHVKDEAVKLYRSALNKKLTELDSAQKEKKEDLGYRVA